MENPESENIINNPEEEITTPEPPKSSEDTPELKPKKNKHLSLWIGSGAFVIVIVLGVVFRDSLLPTNNQPAEVVEGVDSQVVAVVNGESITRDSFNIRFSVVSGTLGAEPNLEGEANINLKSQIIDDLVNTELLLQAASQAGITVSTEEVEAQLQLITDRTGGPAALQAQLNQSGISLDFVRQDLLEQRTIQKYLEQLTSAEDLSVSEEEIAQFYETVKASDETIPAIDEVRSQIESTLVTQKTNDAINRYVAALRQAAEIEILF
jgi:hypothetical protein